MTQTGRPDSGPSELKTRFAFSLHKSGSTLLTRMLQDICDAENLPHENIPGKMFLDNISWEQWSLDEGLLDRITPGKIYFGFRLFPDFLKKADFKRARSVLLVRDPRDALVSRYFSFRPGGSHDAPHVDRSQWLERRDSREDSGIDAFVTKNSERARDQMRSYFPLLATQTVRIFHYKDIYFDKLAFIRDVFEHFEISIPENRLREIAERHDIRPDTEDPSKHIRKGLPGDYKEKLQPETIAWLNSYFGPIGKALGYDLT